MSAILISIFMLVTRIVLKITDFNITYFKKTNVRYQEEEGLFKQAW